MVFKIEGLGACREVGRSAFVVDAGDKILLDYGAKIEPERTTYPLPVKTNLNAIVISHAHLDHSGYLPHLFLTGNTLCYMTQPTLAIAEVLWKDALKIADIESKEIKYSKQEIEHTKTFTFPALYRRHLNITKHMSMEFYDAGHIIGSAMVKLMHKNKSLLYTGDFNPLPTRMLAGADTNLEADYVISESTYGTTNHPPREQTEKEFVDAINETLDKGGIALVPAFAVSRSQELIEILYSYKVNADVYLDGMGQKIFDITLAHSEYLKDPRTLKKAMQNCVFVQNERQRAKLLKNPCVVVSSAGMLAGGPALYYLKRMYNDPKSSVYLTGYQVEKTPGRQLIEKGTIGIKGEEVRVTADVRKFDFSAHADKNSMLACYKKWNPEKILLVHGDPQTMDPFAELIKQELGIETSTLEAGKAIKL